MANHLTTTTMDNNIRSFYDLHQREYDAFERSLDGSGYHYRSLVEFRNTEKEYLKKIPRFSRVLYIGTGTGRHILDLVRRQCSVTTIDFSSAMIAQSETAFTHTGIVFERKLLDQEKEFQDFEESPERVLLFQGDVRDAAWPKKIFDYAFCYCTLPLMGSPDWHRLLKMVSESTQNVIISIYSSEILEDLAAAYSEHGLQARIDRNRMIAKDGFVYEAISDSLFREKVAECGMICDSTVLSAGRIYKCRTKS